MVLESILHHLDVLVKRNIDEEIARSESEARSAEGVVQRHQDTVQILVRSAQVS